ncbi:MAG TPA: regulator [Bacteroidales bacterium]|jgi:DNA-binding NtrC family response regulator|nr:regulator [Bacteroidales bacterium]
MSSKPFKIFVVEDDEWYNKLLVHNLSLNPDYEVISFFNGNDCLTNLDQQPDVITLDFKLPDITGIEVLKKIKQENYETQVILISEQDDIEVVVELLKEGAYDYIVKSNDIKERLHNTVLNIRKNVNLKNEISQLKKEVQKKYSYSNTLIGDSDAIKAVHELINKALVTNINVSISGETGTGKELVAKAIHYNSNRKTNPFVAVNVSAIPSELVESELFGHEKGAFTGAAFKRIGKFEEANGGTLFLDEIGDMDISFQAKLLRALQEKEITRVGSNKNIKVNCRIITATHKNLALEVKNGNFRQDLYYRLIGLPIELPTLRERNNDVLILAKHFVKTFCNENKLQIKNITPDARKKLKTHSFPGNIRELKSVIELAVTLSSNDEINDYDILFNSEELLDNNAYEDLTLRQYEWKIVSSYLQKYNNDVRLVAKKLDIGTATIYRMIKEMETAR